MTENHFSLARLDFIDEHTAVLLIPLHECVPRATLGSESMGRAVYKRLELDNVHNKPRNYVFLHVMSWGRTPVTVQPFAFVVLVGVELVYESEGIKGTRVTHSSTLWRELWVLSHVILIYSGVKWPRRPLFKRSFKSFLNLSYLVSLTFCSYLCNSFPEWRQNKSYFQNIEVIPMESVAVSATENKEDHCYKVI